MILGVLIMEEKEIEIGKKYDNMINNVKEWETLAKNIPSSLKKSFTTLHEADTPVLKTRAMNSVKAEYKMMMLHLDIMLSKDYSDIDEKTVKMLKDYEYTSAKKAGYIQDFDKKTLELQLHAPLFTRRSGSLVDASTESVIQEIIDARVNMAALIDGLRAFDKEDLSEAELVITEWAKTLILETVPLSSINPKNQDLSFGSTYEILSQNASINKLRQYRRAFDEKFDSKNDEGVLIARHKVKWSGKLEDAPVINYTPVKRAKKGENKK